MSTFDARLADCGCCELPFAGTPAVIFNRPALNEIEYRVGTHGSFRQAMVRRTPIVDEALRRSLGLSLTPLGLWTSREDDDYGMALLSLWATVADILTFYQERYINEAYLRTADHHDSIRRLAGLLGYRLNPGVAAETYLAFTLQDRATLTIPAGLLTQSVPAEDEMPQKFETSELFIAEASRNRIPVFGTPVAVTPLTPLPATRVHATLEDGAFVPTPGDRFVAFGTAPDVVEERTVETVEEVDGRSVVTWSRPLTSSHAKAYLRRRDFQMFGHSAPATYVISEASTEDTNLLTWSSHSTDYDITAGPTVYLDGIVDGIETGSQVLVVSQGETPVLTKVTGVAQVTATVGPQSGSATRLTLSNDVTGDVRTSRVYELGELLEFQSWEIPSADTIAAGSTELHIPLDGPRLKKGHLVVVDDDTDCGAQAIEIAADVSSVDFDGTGPVMLKVELAEATARDLTSDSAHLLANVVEATHGETIDDEIIGDGDAATALQSFQLKKAPVTHIADAMSQGGAASTLSVRVSGVEWEDRVGLFGAGPQDRIYTTSIDDDHKTTVHFGDGSSGARLPTGKANIAARYRQGIGSAGILGARQITTALDRPRGLKAVVNPVPATGGVDAETTTEAGENAPNTVRTFDRAVSLRDFEDLAREFTRVDKALATWVWTGDQRAVHVTVAGPDGVELTAAQLSDLRVYLDLRRDPNRDLLIAGYLPVDIEVDLSVRVAADRITEEVSAAVESAIEEYFDFSERRFAQAVHLSDIYAETQGVDGVVSVRVNVLRYELDAVAVAHGAGSEPAIVHLGIDPARPATTPHAVPSGAELAVLGSLKVSASGGLAE
jgi:hypothetical protein